MFLECYILIRQCTNANSSGGGGGGGGGSGGGGRSGGSSSTRSSRSSSCIPVIKLRKKLTFTNIYEETFFNL